ncbi:MAG: hypothetical protein J07HQX50_02843 [Haloquadratum sp. J07HQX50]|nr:MAG: hypothetical protein J07HQX50_02843 [Haloquadratum sp. J07HQX50]
MSMSDQFLNLPSGLVSTETKIRIAFIILGIVSWLGIQRVTDDQRLQLLVLHGIGNIAPSIINEWRD